MTSMKEKKYINNLTYEMVSNAVGGDEVAREQICNYYEPYIIKLSRVPFYDKEGQLQYKIDEDIYMRLKLTVYEVIQTFRIA